jgi:phage terminase large subunit-like protein
MASLVAIRHGQDGYIKPDRVASREKIDGIIALIIAIRCATTEEPEQASVYDERGMLFL